MELSSAQRKFVFAGVVLVLAALGAFLIIPNTLDRSSTGHGRAVGLTAPLSGDVVLPTMPVAGTEIVLVDSAQGSSSIVWVDAKTMVVPAPGGLRGFSIGGGAALPLRVPGLPANATIVPVPRHY